MTRSRGGRVGEGKSIAKDPSRSVGPTRLPVNLHALERPLTAREQSKRKITALISRAVGICHSKTVIFKLRAILRKLRRREYPLTIEHGLSALGIAIAVASSAFASYMISQDLQGRRESGGLAQSASLSASQASRFGNVSVDPITTGSIAPATGSTRGGLGVVGDRLMGFDAAGPRLPGYVLRDVFEGVALVEGNGGIRAVKPGFTLPEGSKVTAIERHDGKWVVVTTGGIISDGP